MEDLEEDIDDETSLNRSLINVHKSCDPQLLEKNHVGQIIRSNNDAYLVDHFQKNIQLIAK